MATGIALVGLTVEVVSGPKSQSTCICVLLRNKETKLYVSNMTEHFLARHPFSANIYFYEERREGKKERRDLYTVHVSC